MNYRYYLKTKFRQYMYAFPILPIGLLIVWWNGIATYLNVFSMILIIIWAVLLASRMKIMYILVFLFRNLKRLCLR